ncbi:MAG: hypothetical protein QCI82_11525 [Candidatus Thermoplasmatota archaeon]|nr:hypothetical protein [Candidatus Thermoplasmatota archaeon]
MKEAFLRYFPRAFILAAHLGGVAISLWMNRWDLLAAGIAFGIPSTLLFLDLLPGGKGHMIKLIERIIR